MQKARRGRSIVHRAILLSFVAITLLSSAIAAFFPALEQRASAASNSAVNLPQRTVKINPNLDVNVAYGTCEPYWDKTTKSRQFLAEHFYSNMDQLPYEAKDNPADEWNWLVNEYDERTIDSRIGTDFGDSDFLGDDQPKIDRAARMLQLMGKQEIPIIRFRPAPAGTQPMDGTYSGNGGVCNGYAMIPVDYPQAGNRAGSWRGLEFFNATSSGGSNNPERARGEFMEFKLTGSDLNTGSFNYWGKREGNTLVQRFLNKTLNVQGTYPTGTGSGTLPNVGTINADWIDAGNIKVKNSPQNFAGEEYKKRSWNTRRVGDSAYSYYFLEKASPGREARTWANNSKKCEDALPISSACGGSGICVPFIAVKQQLNVDHNNFGRLQNDINQLGGSQAELYDFNSSCVADARYTIALDSAANAKIWLYYSTSQKAFLPVFTTGDGNEVKYIGTYNEIAAPAGGGPLAGNPGQYKLGECMATIAANPLTPGANDIFPANWTLTDGNCNTLQTYGTLNVTAKGGAAGEAAFGKNLEDGQGTGDAGNGEAKFICSLTTGVFNWVFCPLTRLALEAIDAFEATINDALTLKTDRIFNDNFHKVWAGFRTLALSILVIVALVMVISQAAGLSFLDAYIIKTTLPRVLFAAIAITFSWPVMQFLVVLSNDAGSWIRYLIYSPFPNTTDLGGVGFTGFLVGALSSGALLALGILGMGSFILTAFLGAGMAFVFLVARELIVMAAAVAVPFGLAAKALPKPNPLEKIAELPENAFKVALMVMPIFMGIVAMGRVFSITAIQSGGNETINQIVAIVAYILPYFLITTAFRLAGGVMAAVSGAVNDKTKGGFDRLRKFRSNQREDRGKRFREGKLYDSNNMLFQPGRRGPLGTFADVANKVGERRGLGWQRGRFGFGERGRQASAMREFIEADHTRDKDEWIKALSNTDDAGMLVLAASGGTGRGARDFVRQRVASGKWTRQQGNEALQAAFAVGINRGTAIASLQKLAENKSREVDPGDIATIRNAIAEVSEGNSTLADKLSWDFQFRARTAGGRVDLGGVWHTPEKRREAVQLATSMTAAGVNTGFNGRTLATGQDVFDDASGVVAYFDGADRSSVQQALAGHPNEIKALSHAVKTAFAHGTAEQKEKAALLSYEVHKGLAAGQASASNREEVNKFLSEIGVDAGTLAAATPRGAPPVTVEDVLARKVGTDPLVARDTTGNVLPGSPQRAYTAAMLTARARAFDTQAQRGNIMGNTGTGAP